MEHHLGSYLKSMKTPLRYVGLAIATFLLAMTCLAAGGMATSPGEARIPEIEQTWKDHYLDYLDLEDGEAPLTGAEIRATLAQLGSETQSQFALVYIFPHEENLELLLVLPEADPVHIVQPQVPLATLTPALNEFRLQISHATQSGRSLTAAQHLYQWIVAPLEATLAAHDVDTLIFCVGQGVRSAPLAALHDGNQFLVERYGVAVIPAFSLTDSHHIRVSQTQVLAMGASEFRGLIPLPAVPVELAAIAQDLWQGEVFLNQDFTYANLQQQLDSGLFSIVHLATHAAFQPGDPDQSYIQLWQGDRLHLDEVRNLAWSDRPVELLVLSACQTALGDREAELGFAGLSFNAGVKSTLASLWYVNDLGTLALMREFYWQLAQPDVKTKAEALRRAQVAMIHGSVRIETAQLLGSGAAFPLPPGFESSSPAAFTTPYHWAGFTLVGSPW